MNIKMPGLVSQNTYGLKSVEDRLQRLQQRDDKIQFFENQKEKLKEMTSTDLSDIARKLELLHGYEDQIAAAKKEFNNSQVYKVMEEAEERGEKIRENAEKTEPKTPEERRKDAIKEAIEEATGVEQPDGMLSEIMGAGGTSNLVISRNIAEQMKKDPELAAVIEERIAKLPEEGKQIENDIHAMGHEVLACGMQIDKNGRISYWSIGYDPHASEKQAQCAKEKAEELKERQDKLMEKAAERKKKAKELEENREARREENKEQMERLLSRGESPKELIEKVRNHEQETIKSDAIDTRKGLSIDVSL